MKSAVVKLSDLARENRMDAGFHIALSEVRDAVASLRTRHTDAEAIRIVDALPLGAKKGMMPLLRGRAVLDEEGSRRLAREYPHLSLALVSADAAANARAIREEISRNEASLALLLELAGAPEARA